MKISIIFGLISIGTVPTAVAAQADQAPRPLRVALVEGNAAQAVRDPKTGALQGISVEVAKALAQRRGRPLSLILLNPTAMLQALDKGDLDLGFLAPRPGFEGRILFSKPYMLVYQSAIILKGSSLANASTLDGNGITIGANSGDSIAQQLKATLRKSTLIESGDWTMREPVRWLREGKIAAFAGNRQRLGLVIAGERDLALLPHNIGSVSHIVAVAASNGADLPEIEADLATIKTSDPIAAIVAADPSGGIMIAR